MNKAELRGWILQAFEGRLDEVTRARLNTILLESAEARAYYFEFLEISLTLRQIKHVQTFHDLDAATAEKPAPAPPMAERPAMPAPVVTAAEPVAETPPASRAVVISGARVNRALFFTTVAACLLAIGMFLYVQRVGRQRGEPEAVLAEATQARWAHTTEGLERGSKLYAGPLRLAEGAARLVFDSGAEVIVQAPADMLLEAGGRLMLRRGSLTVRLEEPREDFIVRTPAANVIDYGADSVFGISAGPYGRTEVHVLEGRVGLRNGSDPLRFETNLLLEAGQAASADEQGQLATIPYQGEVYLAQLPEKGSFGTPGRRVDVADLAAGGNGFDGGRKDRAINPLSGAVVTIENNWEIWLPSNGPLEEHAFYPAGALPFVDGVFGVGPSEAPLPVSSTGTTLADVPASSGAYGMMIVTDSSWTQKPWVLGEAAYGTLERPAILVHANAGITFDLESLRRSLGDLELVRFRALCGIPENLEEADEDAERVDARMSVLLDGREVFGQTVRHGQAKAYPVETPLAADNRFLTLMCTNGTDGSNLGDWGVFAEPAIELQPAKNGPGV